VFAPGDDAVLALNGDRLMRIPVMKGTKTEMLHRVPDVEKLVGIDRDHPDRLLVTRSQPSSPLAVLSIGSGRLTMLPYDAASKDQRRMLLPISGGKSGCTPGSGCM